MLKGNVTSNDKSMSCFMLFYLLVLEQLAICWLVEPLIALKVLALLLFVYFGFLEGFSLLGS